LNLRPLQPHCSALAGLRYAPISGVIITEHPWFDKHFGGEVNWYNLLMSDDASPSDYAPFIALAIVLVLFVLALVGLIVAALIIFVFTSSAPAATITPAVDVAPLNRLAVIDTDRIYTINPDGSDQLELKHSGSVPTAAVIWSHDGQRLLFVETERNQSRLISARLDGAAPLILFETDRLSAPFYLNGSPDDRAVAFLIPSADSAMELQIAQTDRPGSARLALAGRPNYSSWSPDSRSLLAHIGGDQADAFVGTYTLSDTQSDKLETGPAAFQAPVWLPDATDSWLYARQQGLRGELVLNAAGTVETLATFRGGVAFTLAPGGQQVAYALNTPDSFLYNNLTIIDLATRATQTVYKGNLVGFFWSPDGKKMAYLTGALVEPASIGRAGGLAAPPVAQSQRVLQLTWHVIDLTSGQTIDLNTFEPTESFIYLLTYFDQFAQSTAVWSPDSRSLVYTGAPLIGERGVYVVDTQQPDGSPRFIGPGDFAIWSWR
jgi:Tol biopolymer transport system component